MMVRLNIFEGGGNVFADLDFSVEDPANLQFQSAPMTRLTKVVRDRDPT